MLKSENAMSWYNCICPGLVKLSLKLISEGCKHYQIRISDGRLADLDNVGTTGRLIFVEVATCQINQKNLEDQLSELISKC